MTRFDAEHFLSLLAQAGHPGPLRRGRRWLLRCPVCGKAAVKLSPRTGYWACYYCRYANQTEGRAERFLAVLLGITERAARGQLHGEDAFGAVLDLPDDPFSTEEVEDEVVLPPRLTWPYHAHELTHPHAARGVAYLEGRGIPLQVAIQYGIRYSPVDRRVLFPAETEGRLVGWQGRYVGENTWTDDRGEVHEVLRLLSTPDIPRGQILMFQDRIVDGVAVLTEGPVDALKADLVGGNVCAMGKIVTEGQLDVLRRKGVKRLYLALDPDATDEVDRIVRALYADMEIYRVVLPRGVKDLGEMTMQAAQDTILASRRAYPWDLHVHFGGAA